MNAKILRISRAEVCGPHRLRLAFNDGAEGEVDVGQLLYGAVFQPLLAPEYFARMSLDPICGTVTWPNGADFAPEALRCLLPKPENARVGAANAID
ncbi:MAG TPA: DUF2442 domain-containing protein [Planctomycetia bacterium]|nr:DUF2442 domain-containing protein [Planctomycetia bacterium]